ncbi:MAG TPA: DUF72 domain-containing protein [Solibacterales bacterium]|nr:DUF72 domain-containing protein [Bryobacterales bacterium]
MTPLSLFDDAPGGFDRRALGQRLRELAARGVWFGTSSWKYEGWLEQIYTRERYQTRGRFSKKLFEESCLAEYSETFPIVCGDFSFYQFPSEAYWRRVFTGAPGALQFAFKVPEEVTVKRWPTHPRYGPRGGQANDSFLNARIFDGGFARPLLPYRAQVAVLIFEFGAFPKGSYDTAGDFLRELDPFLGGLPRGFRYAIEIRNPEFLAPEYFACLRSHNVAHVFNAWTRMPELPAQAAIEAAYTADFTVARALLSRGRMYEEAVERFSPYQSVQEENPGAREGLRVLTRRALRESQPAFLFVNNRLEGNAPMTIEGVIAEV